MKIASEKTFPTFIYMSGLNKGKLYHPENA